tara:strand:- start:38 stop:490 length:453 start_codon:yes stop_codon:yes gene_type:complete
MSVLMIAPLGVVWASNDQPGSRASARHAPIQFAIVVSVLLLLLLLLAAPALRFRRFALAAPPPAAASDRFRAAFVTTAIGRNRIRTRSEEGDARGFRTAVATEFRCREARRISEPVRRSLLITCWHQPSRWPTLDESFQIEHFSVIRFGD